MSKPTFIVRRKYNKAAYDRHEISIGKDTELAHRLMAESNVAGLIKDLLCAHYGISVEKRHDYLAGVAEDG
jgi:hypothetical protein